MLKRLKQNMPFLLLFLSFSAFSILFLLISAGTIYMKHSIVLMKKKMNILSKEEELKSFEKNSLEAILREKKEILLENIHKRTVNQTHTETH